MAKKTAKVNADPLTPAQTRADWEAQGWASESEPLIASPRLQTTISIRFDPDSAMLLRRAARLKGVTKSQFVRLATLREAQKTIDETPLPVSIQVRDQPKVSTRSYARGMVERGPLPMATTRGTTHMVEPGS